MAGMLLVLVGVLGMVPVAGAAEIPPTEECSKLNKELTREYYAALKGNVSAKKRKRADREFAEKLAEADCISDAAPVIKELKAKPRTEQCAVASAAADAFWAPYSSQMLKLSLKGLRATKPLRQRLKRVSKRIRKLRASGASKQRIRAATRTRKVVLRKMNRRERPYNKQLRQLIAPQAHDTSLIFTELMALRCVSIDSLVDAFVTSMLNEKQRDPVAKVIEKHLGLIFTSAIYLLIKYEIGDSGSSHSSSLASVSSFTQPDGLRFPLIPLP